MSSSTLSASLRAGLAVAVLTGVAAAPSGTAQAVTATRIAPLPTAWKSTSAYEGAKYAVTGTVSPAAARSVHLQRYSSGHWTRVSTVRTSRGRFSLAVPTGKPGAETYRMYVPAGAGASAVVSTKISFTVRSRSVPAVGSKGSASAYRFLLPMSGGGAARWNPCRPITYRVNTKNATSGALADVKGTFARIASVTGLQFVHKGSTTALPRNSYAGQPADANILIAWAPPGASDMLPKVPAGSYGAAGMGGSRATTAGWTASGKRQDRMVQGHVLLDSTRKLAAGFGTGPSTGWQGTRGQLLMHEIGHVIGLNHVTGDPWQMMKPTMSRMYAVYGAGDVAGLRKLGKAMGCIYSSDPTR